MSFATVDQSDGGKCDLKRIAAVLLRLTTIAVLVLPCVVWRRSTAEVEKEEKSASRVVAFTELGSSPSCKANDQAIRRFVGELATQSGCLPVLSEVISLRLSAVLIYSRTAPALCSRICHLALHDLAGGQLS